MKLYKVVSLVLFSFIVLNSVTTPVGATLPSKDDIHEVSGLVEGIYSKGSSTLHKVWNGFSHFFDVQTEVQEEDAPPVSTQTSPEGTVKDGKEINSSLAIEQDITQTEVVQKSDSTISSKTSTEGTTERFVLEGTIFENIKEHGIPNGGWSDPLCLIQ